MKKTLLFLAITTLFFVSNFSSVNAQCKASYVFYQNGKTVSFYDSSFVNVMNPSYYWNFGDGKTDTGQYTTHSYSKYGTYYVCHGVYSANCTDTVCDSIMISAPSCKAMFKNYSYGLNCDFYNSSSSISGSPSYKWNFGDGSTSMLDNPKHNYASAGTYTVCLYENDSAGNCSDSICMQVVISSQNANCSARFKYSTQNGITYFDGPYNANGSAYTSYSWGFGDGTSSTQQSPSHAYNSTGPYLVCLTIKDTGCSDTYCDTLFTNSNGGGNCNVYFTDSTYGDTTAFNALTKGTNGNITYSWDFGDGTSSTQQNPVHVYPKAGMYYACLTITDSSCTSSYCNYINKGSNNTGRYTVMGQITAGNTFANPAMVWAINYDSTAGTLTGVDSTMTDSFGFYYFSLSKGFYLIKAAMDGSNGNISNYMPTYYINKLTWDSATQLQVDTDYYNINIDLLAGNNPGGPGFIGGKTSQGANKTNTTGDPVNQVQINLMDANKKAVAYTYSDANGDFKFSNIAYGTYYISPEAVGKKSNELMVLLSPTNASINNIKVEVNKKYIDVSLLTGITTAAILSGVEVWPNPANEYIYIKSNSIISNIYITDITGKTVLTQNKSENTINISSLDAGLYIMQIRTKDGMLVPYKFVKQ